MANVIAKATGAWSTAATWCQAEEGAGAIQAALTATTNTTGSYVPTAAFTCTNLDSMIGVLMVCKRVNSTGTVTVGLSDDNGASYTREVTVNAADLPLEGSGVLFMFSLPLAADGGSDYKLAIKASSAGNATFWRDGTAANWTRLILLAADYGVPQAGDVIWIAGEPAVTLTVTMDNTAATDHGAMFLGHRGVLTCGVAESTAYFLKLSGVLTMWPGSTLSLGTSGARIPASSSMTLEFDSASAAQFGIENAGGTFNAYGALRTYISAKLTANVAVNGTALASDVSTGWKSGDEILLPSTSFTAAQFEVGDLDGDAAGTALTVHGFAGVGGGVAYAHSGTAPYQGEILLLTHNVRIRGASASLTGYVRAYANGSALAVVNWSYAEFYWLGIFNGATKIGVHVSGTSTSADVQYCSFHHFIAASVSGPYIECGTMTVSYNVFHGGATNTTDFRIYPSTVGNVVTRNFFIAGDNAVIDCQMRGSYTFNTIASCGAANLTNTWQSTAVFEDNVYHSNSAAENFFTWPGGVFTRITYWRQNHGIRVAYRGFTYVSCNFTTTSVYDFDIRNVTYRSCIWENDTVTSQNYGYNLGNINVWMNVRFEECTFGVITQYAIADIFVNSVISMVQAIFDNCLLNSIVPLVVTGGQSFFQVTSDVLSFLKFAKWGQTAGSHRTYYRQGLIQTDAVIYDVGGVSERATPKIAATDLGSTYFRKRVASGATCTFTVRVRKSAVGDAGGANYTGSEPRLLVKVNHASGLAHTVPLVLDTAAAAVGTWETLTGTTGAVTDDAVLEAFVDCDGAVGWINVQNWS